MVRIAEKKLIIEISTGSQEPMAVLADFQRGIIDLMSVIPYGHTDTPNEHLDFGMHIITRLMREIILTQDQGSRLNEGLTEQQIEEVNKWSR